MPELPEVETTRRGISPALEGKHLKALLVRNSRLRWPIENDLAGRVEGQKVHSVFRRAKYLLIRLDTGHLIVHLGMSGSLRLVPIESPVGKHDHFDIVLDTDNPYPVLRYRDPRRFGALLWTEDYLDRHPLLRSLGPEPLGELFSGQYLYEKFRRSSRPVKVTIMDATIVVGVGNIYANESLFVAGIAPDRPSNSLSAKEAELLVNAIRAILVRAIEAGGSTLRDYQSSSGAAGYFQQEYKVYGLKGAKCSVCQNDLQHARIGQRSTFWCPFCQH